MVFLMQPNSNDKSDQQSDSDALNHCRRAESLSEPADKSGGAISCWTNHDRVTICRGDEQDAAHHSHSIEATSMIPSQRNGAIGRRLWAAWASVLVFSVFMVKLTVCKSWSNNYPSLPAFSLFLLLFFFLLMWTRCLALLCVTCLSCRISAALMLPLKAAQRHPPPLPISLLMFQDFIAFPTGYPVRQTDSYKSSSNNLLGSCKQPQLSFISLLYSFMTIEWSFLRVALMAERDRRIPY